MKTSAIIALVATAFLLNVHTLFAGTSNVEPEKLNPTFILSLDALEEESLEVAPWMLDIDSFSSGFMEETFEEPDLLIEDWMLDVDAFNESVFSEKEEMVQIEDWMLSVVLFNCNEEDEMHPVEKWMFNF
jgi:hypothetical protein